MLDVAGVGEVHARYAIAADGMWSPTRKALGLGVDGYRGEWHAFRQYFTDVGPRAARQLFVWFDPDLLPGYAWSFPLPDGGANVGFGIQLALGGINLLPEFRYSFGLSGLLSEDQTLGIQLEEDQEVRLFMLSLGLGF